jgi:hypothetical protein
MYIPTLNGTCANPCRFCRMKRSLTGDADELCHHLQSIRACLLRVKEDLYHLIQHSDMPPTNTPDHDNKENLHPQCNKEAGTLQQSSAHLLRCCLHLYNTLEEGLNYLEDPRHTMVGVEATMQSVDALAQVLSSYALGTLSVSIQEPVCMLRRTLETIQQEMISPTDLVMEQQIKRKEHCVSISTHRHTDGYIGL